MVEWGLFIVMKFQDKVFSKKVKLITIEKIREAEDLFKPKATKNLETFPLEAIN